jgi:carboxypeptidase C (cathepsin A)
MLSRRAAQAVIALPAFIAALASGPVSAHDLSAAQAAAFAFAPTETQPERPPMSVHVTRHWTAGKASLDYEASVDEYTVRDHDHPVGLVATYGYQRVPADASRPVVFVFNGGPGASSWSLHLEGIGPVIYDATGDRFVDNKDSLIDTADLVFIDPLATGASLPFTGADTTGLWSVDGDAEATWQVIQQWLVAHDRKGAPIFVMGESYGGARVTAMLHDMPADPVFDLKGVALLSAAIGGLSPSDQKVATQPSIAATNAFHGWDEHTDPSGKVGKLDTRVDDDGSLRQLPPPYSDPSMTLGKRPATLMARYLASLGYRLPHAYRMLNLTINRAWNYGGPPERWPFAGYVAAGMAARPELRLFTAEGIYDLATPASASAVAFRRAGVQEERWTNVVYPAGHTIGEDPGQRPRLSADLRHFIE